MANGYVFTAPPGVLTPGQPDTAPDTMPAWTATTDAINSTSAANNHGLPPTHSQATHADSVPTSMPDGYSEDTEGKGRGE